MIILVHTQKHICIFYHRPHLDGGQTLLQGGEFLVQALQALSSNILDLADEFNGKMLRLEEDIHEYYVLDIVLTCSIYILYYSGNPVHFI